MRPIYLTGERIFLRAMVPEDKNHTIAWFDSPLPVNSAFGERHLTEIHKSLWDARTRQYAVVRTSDEAVIGGATVTFGAMERKAWIALHMAPLLKDADDLQAETLTVLVPWLLDDHNMRRVDVTLPADQTATINAAAALGMFEGVRLRQFLRRPGGRVDAVIYQKLNPHMEHLYA